MGNNAPNTTVHFKINTPQFLKEVFDNYPGNGGVLKVPVNVLRTMLWAVAERASELNDPILNGLMCDMALYAIADPYDKQNYDYQRMKDITTNKIYMNWKRK